MNVIFLDIDGVLLAYQPSLYFNQIQYGYDPHVFNAFLSILENSPEPTKIVLVSTKVANKDPFRWISDEKSLERFKRLLHPEMPSIEWKYVHEDRYTGVAKWLEEYGQYVNKSIAIDDSLRDYIEKDKELLSSEFYLIPCRTAYGMHWVELKLLEYLLKPVLKKTDKDFIKEYLYFGFVYDNKQEIVDFWNRTINHICE